MGLCWNEARFIYFFALICKNLKLSLQVLSFETRIQKLGVLKISYPFLFQNSKVFDDSERNDGVEIG